MTHAEFFNKLTWEQREIFASDETAKHMASGFYTWEQFYKHLETRK